MGQPAEETRAEVRKRIRTSFCAGSKGYKTGEKMKLKNHSLDLENKVQSER